MQLNSAEKRNESQRRNPQAACEEAAAPQEPTMEEAFLRLPFLWAGLDAKESPLLHLIKEFELRALVTCAPARLRPVQL